MAPAVGGERLSTRQEAIKALLQDGRERTTHEIVDELGMEPTRNSVNHVSKALMSLVRYRIVECI